jgi:hypothetical protein
VHIVFSFYPPGVSYPSDTYYANCSGQCHNPASWNAVNISSVIDWTRPSFVAPPMVVTPEGGVYLVTSSLTINADVVLAHCPGNCQNADNWSAGNIRRGGGHMALAVNGQGLHMILHDEGQGLVYRHCPSNCVSEANWTEAHLFVHDGRGRVAMTTSGNEIRVVYNQGYPYDDQPEAVQAQNGRLIYWTCQANCTNESNWRGLLVPTSQDNGRDVTMVSVGAGVLLAYSTENLEMRLDICEGDCLQESSWRYLIADTTTMVNETADPYAVLCGGSRPYFASWYVDEPALAIGPSGQILLAYEGDILKQCALGDNLSRSSGMMRWVAFE